MTATPSIDPARLLHEQLDHAAPDLLRQLLGTFIDALMAPRPTPSAAPPTGPRVRTG